MVSLRFADGSLAAIGYCCAAPTAGKELIEIVAGSHRVVIDDFRSADADGRTLWKGRPDKGHRAQAAVFLEAVRGHAAAGTDPLLATMRATIRAGTADDQRP